MPVRIIWGLLLISLSITSAGAARAEAAPAAVLGAWQKAGDNRPELERAWQDAPPRQRAGMEFLLTHMPESDAKSLTAELLLANLRWAYKAREEMPWGKQLPEEVFFNDVLPYASVTERRDNWREDFYARCRPLVKDARTPSEAAALLNQKLFSLLKVKYSTKRQRADQGPYESMKSGLASCTGLSVLLIDACRAVAVPARLAGTPLWSDNSGNHSWVEVWDQQWHFTGAAEPTGTELNRAWFLGRASQAQRDDRRHAIYATSYRRTPLSFPMVWARGNGDVPAVNVTTRYTKQRHPLPAGFVHVYIRAVNGQGQRIRARVQVTDAAGKQVFAGLSNDEGFDSNDHLELALAQGQKYQLQAKTDASQQTLALQPSKPNELITVRLPE